MDNRWTYKAGYIKQETKNVTNKVSQIVHFPTQASGNDYGKKRGITRHTKDTLQNIVINVLRRVITPRFLAWATTNR